MEDILRLIDVSEVLAVLATILTPVLAAVLREVFVVLRAELVRRRLLISRANFEFLREAAEAVVQEAEQAGLVGRIEDIAQAKLAHALLKLDVILAEQGVNVSLAAKQTAIEAALRRGVHKMGNLFSELVISEEAE